MKTNYKDIIILVDSLASLHDPNANGHGDRTAKLAVQLAKNLGQHKDFLRILNFAMRVHDVGKIPISETILNKVGKLTLSEKGMIKSHSWLGMEALRKLKFNELVYSIIYQHHENWDGSGYPHGLKGNAINMGARIARVVDCYDAMTNIRPYREIFSTKHALEEMKKENGISFDPEIFEAFYKMILMEF